MLTVDELKKLIQQNEPDAYIQESRDYHEAIVRHTADEGVTTFLSRIEKYENTHQLNLRQRFYISTKHVIGDLQKPAQNIWSAIGGSFSFDGTDKQREEFFKQKAIIAQGRSLDEFIQEDYFTALYDDPAGGVFVAFDEIGKKKNKKITIQIHPVSIKSIRAYKPFGRGVEWILFEPEIIGRVDDKEEGSTKEIKRYLYMDAEYKIVVTEKNGNLTAKKSKNPRGFVPFVLNTTRYGKPNIKPQAGKDAKYHDKVKIPLSVIDNELQLLDAYIRKLSVKEVHEFLHAYPEYWKYVYPCPECDGSGVFQGHEGTVECKACGGSGMAKDKKELTTFTRLLPPREGEPALDPPSGYISPDIEILEEMRTELDYKRNDIHRSHWGTPFTTDARATADAETATGRLIDIQPTMVQLNVYTDIIESMYNALMGVVIRLMFPFNYENIKAHKSYGRGYIVESGNIALERYSEAREAGLSQSLLDSLLLSYYAAQFRSDEMKFLIMSKLMDVEPFIHYTVEQVQGMEGVSQEDKRQKYYYSQWLAQVSNNDLKLKSDKELREMLAQYVESKIQDNGTED